MATLRELYESLSGDPFRKELGFSDDLRFAHEALFQPYLHEADVAEALRIWIQGADNQPCVFGSVAAATRKAHSLGTSALHFCVLRERTILEKTDDEVAKLVHEERLHWKRRSLMWGSSVSTPAHGFVLAVVAPRLAYAANDQHLLAFSERVLQLWGSDERNEPSGRMHFETLFLRDPRSNTYVKFSFSIDFFLAAADRRWFHDHRIPGGIAFTANSVGHMQRYREWYENKGDQCPWMVQNAMRTIGNARNTAWGPATWLRDLDNRGLPYIPDLACPFLVDTGKDPSLKNKDWTKYAGHLHTDHSIRPEFFMVAPEKPASVTQREHIQDFTYLQDNRETDYVRFVLGEPVAERDVFSELGNPRDWTSVVGPRPTGRPPLGPADIKVGSAESSDRERAAAFLRECSRRWPDRAVD